jgi:hypothetical protein
VQQSAIDTSAAELWDPLNTLSLIDCECENYVSSSTLYSCRVMGKISPVDVVSHL